MVDFSTHCISDVYPSLVKGLHFVIKTILYLLSKPSYFKQNVIFIFISQPKVIFIVKTDIVIVVIFPFLLAKKVPVPHPRVIISVDGGGGQEKVATCNRKDGLINFNIRKY